MPIVDLAFPLLAPEPIPADHGYHLYGALSRILPQLHETNGIAVHPIRGQQTGNRQLQLNDRSRLVLRADADHIGQLVALAGKQLDVAGHRLRVGVPQVWTLRPAPAVRSRLVTIKGFLDPEPFQAAARRHLDEIGVSAEAQLTLGKRRTLRIKDKEVVGYEVLVEALSAEESLTVQERGLGGRRHMGCGVFVAISDREGL
jgi:CRISPR-associated protein Cas6